MAESTYFPIHTLQFFIKFTEEEWINFDQYMKGKIASQKEFYKSIKFRIYEILKERGWEDYENTERQLHGKFENYEEDIVIRKLDTDENEYDAIVILRFEPVGEMREDGLFGEIFHQTKRNGKFYLNDEQTEWWNMWIFIAEFKEDKQMEWPPCYEYTPFITYKDYQTFAENGDDLSRCLQSFKEEMPSLLKSFWSSEYQEEIEFIESSQNVVWAFNLAIRYPSWEGYSIIDDMFTFADHEQLKKLSEDIYTIFGYFYAIHLH